MKLSHIEQLKIYMDKENTRLEGAIEHLAELIKQKAWQDKDYEMTKTDFLAEYHINLGKYRQLIELLDEINFIMEAE